MTFLCSLSLSANQNTAILMVLFCDWSEHSTALTRTSQHRARLRLLLINTQIVKMSHAYFTYILIGWARQTFIWVCLAHPCPFLEPALCGVAYIFGCQKFSASLVNGQNDSLKHAICLDDFLYSSYSSYSRNRFSPKQVTHILSPKVASYLTNEIQG